MPTEAKTILSTPPTSVTQTGAIDKAPSDMVVRSASLLVETIHGRTRRYFFSEKSRRLIPQWMWGDNEQEFDKQTSLQQHSPLGIVSTWRNALAKVQSVFHATLLPAGFPFSVHKSYVRFHIWQFGEAITSSVFHVLSAQAMLSAVGLPTNEASSAAGAVAIRWVVKDGLANFAKLAFTKAFAHLFDSRPKTWVMTCALLYLTGVTFELSTAISASAGYASLFIPLAAFGASLLSAAHLIWEATHANFIRWMSIRNNIADVTAKADAQMVVADILGLGIGVFVIQFFGYTPFHLFSYFLILAPVHVGCAYGRMKSIRFGNLNTSRALQLFNMYVEHRGKQTLLAKAKREKKAEKKATATVVVPIVAAAGSPVGVTIGCTAVHAPLNSSSVLPLLQTQGSGMSASSGPLHATLTPASASASTTSVPPVLAPIPESGESSSTAVVAVASVTSGAGSVGTHAGEATLGPAAPQEEKVSAVLQMPSPTVCFATDTRFGEWFYPSDWKKLGYPNVVLGDEVAKALRTEEEINGAIQIYGNELYLLVYRKEDNTIYVSYEDNCTDEDVLLSMLQATKLAYNLVNMDVSNEEAKEREKEKEKDRKKLVVARVGPLPMSEMGGAVLTEHQAAAVSAGLTEVSPSAPVPFQMHGVQISTELAPTVAVGADLEGGAQVVPSKIPSSSMDLDDPFSQHGYLKTTLEWAKMHIDQAKALMEAAEWDTDNVIWGDRGTRITWTDTPPQTGHKL